MGTTYSQIRKSPVVISNQAILTYQENANPTLLVSHLYAIDHVILSLFHFLFFQRYWYDLPHDGRRNANSQAQQDIINLAVSRGEIPQPTDSTEQDDARTAALAGQIWEEEKVYAGWALIFGWLLKVPLTLQASHLKKGD
jgi:hypothetical protein